MNNFNKIAIQFGIGLLILGSIAILILLIPLLLLFSPFIIFSNARNEEEYKEFLTQNEGKKFFCYTSKKKSRTIIETIILPQLDPDIHIILLDGKIPVSEFPQRHISPILYSITHLGFPNIMKIQNGRVLDISLKKEFYKELILDPSHLNSLNYLN
ncbi:MAG: hypothetical protein J7604_20695 [Sporocytophaga sp.]|uniref:hypothetical protein n=1 Tax=Sporocytophaga sp. TaxID=2231183 RepID=UPI001B1F395C|nr:hypothetical protein [Sporocytophaga sp.]MBO9702643.1 hypothetical protein [Sporocytophaga sp.]